MPIAQFHLGVMYAAGKGVPQNHVEAMKWFRKAADQGDVKAQYYLGLMYFQGIGVPKDFVKAYMWYSMASANGNEKAMENLEILSPKMAPQQIAQAQNEAAEMEKRINKLKE